MGLQDEYELEEERLKIEKDLQHITRLQVS